MRQDSWMGKPLIPSAAEYTAVARATAHTAGTRPGLEKRRLGAGYGKRKGVGANLSGRIEKAEDVGVATG
jgi:hypothetical protein